MAVINVKIFAACSGLEIESLFEHVFPSSRVSIAGLLFSLTPKGFFSIFRSSTAAARWMEPTLLYSECNNKFIKYYQEQIGSR